MLSAARIKNLFFIVGVIFMFTACIEASNELASFSPIFSIFLFWMIGFILATVSVIDNVK